MRAAAHSPSCYEDAQHATADRRLAEIAKLRTLDAETKEWTERAIATRKARGAIRP